MNAIEVAKGRFAVSLSEKSLEAAMKLAKGTYQRSILLGTEAISGSTLRGKAKKWCGRYKASAQNLIGRCRKADLIDVTIWNNGKRLVVIGTADEAANFFATIIKTRTPPAGRWLMGTGRCDGQRRSVGFFRKQSDKWF